MTNAYAVESEVLRNSVVSGAPETYSATLLYNSIEGNEQLVALPLPAPLIAM